MSPVFMGTIPSVPSYRPSFDLHTLKMELELLGKSLEGQRSVLPGVPTGCASPGIPGTVTEHFKKSSSHSIRVIHSGELRTENSGL